MSEADEFGPGGMFADGPNTDMRDELDIYDCEHCGDGEALRVGEDCAYCGRTQGEQ